MDNDDILDNDVIDLSFRRFLKERKLYIFIILNLLFLSFCLVYIFTTPNLKTALYLLGLYSVTNLWLLITYFEWKRYKKVS